MSSNVSSNAFSNSSAGKKLNRQFERENPTILTSTIHEEDVESDENYENEECSDYEDDDDGTEEDYVLYLTLYNTYPCTHNVLSYVPISPHLYFQISIHLRPLICISMSKNCCASCIDLSISHYLI